VKRITVFCGANDGSDPGFRDIASRLGKTLAERNIGIVYGGARVGIMGAVADGALKAGGEVNGILPYFLSAKEIAHDGLSTLIVVDSMHERKLKMYELSDGFIILPGGFGTMDELFETLTWAQLGLHQNPVGLLNINHYYDDLISFVRKMTDKKMLREEYSGMLLISDDIEDLLIRMSGYEAPDVEKWITPDKT